MPRPTNFFEANELATSGPLKGFGLWSDAENWTDGVAVDGDAVYVTSNLGDDDLDALSLDSLLVNAPMTVTGRSLTIGALTSGVPDNSEINATVLPGQGPVTVTIDTIGTAGMTIEATGAGAGAVVRTAVDQPENFAVQNGGEVEIAVTPASVWNLNYDSASVGRFALDDPAASNAISLQHVRAGDVLELPGVSVSNVTFGTDSLSITTSAGVYAFTNVAYDHAPKSYSAAVDPVTGLVAITFADQNVFTPSTKAASGALSGDYVWSNAANWAGGVPVDGEAVSAGATGYDDIAALQLSSLTLNEAGAAANVFVTGASLTIADLEQSGAGGSGMLEVDAADAGAPVTVTLQQSGVVGATFEAKGAHAKFLDQAPTDTTSNTYDVANGGLVELSNAPYSGDVFSYTSSGTFAFKSPGAVVASLMLGVSIGDTIELPGTTVSNVTFGSDSLAITTDAGTYDFDAVTYNPGSQIDGYTAAVDPVTGLEAITFRGPNTFTPTVQVAHSTPGPFLFLWSEPANWSGGTPIEGDTVLTTYTSLVTEYQLGVDDLPNLTLSSLTLALANHVEVEAGSSLTIDSLTEGTETTLSADSTDPTKPAVLTIDTLTGSYYEADISAIGAGATVIDQSATDPVGLYGSGAIYFVSLGGKLEIQSATPASTSRLEYFNSSGTPDGGLGTIALGHPGATNAVLLEGVAPGDVLELPGDAVSAVSFGAGSLSVTTNAGSYDFTNVIYADPVTGYTAAKDPSTGLVAITFSGPDVFEMNVNVTSGPLAGEYLWSNAANWSRGLPVNNDTVVFANPSGYSEDDITTLTLNSLTLGAGGHVYVEGGSSLTVANLVGTTGSELFPDSADDGITAPSSVTVGSITGTGALYAAKGTGASFIDQSPSDAGEIYLASSGGVFELAAAPADASSLGYVGVATFALQHPSASSAASLQGVAPGDVLELPGTSVSAVTFGANSLSVTTDAGTYAFTNVAYATSVTGYTVAHDPTTGLEAITFTGPDVFEQNVKATSGPLAGKYLWSNPANWSNGVPVDGDSVAVADQTATGYDDLAALKLNSLSLNGSDVFVTGSSLTIDAVTGGAHTSAGGTTYIGTLHADALDAGAPVTVTVGTITDSHASFNDEYLAVGTGALFVDQSAVDAGEDYLAPQGGAVLELDATPASTSRFFYTGNGEFAFAPGTGVFAFANPGASTAALLAGVAPGDVLELPGTSVSAVTFGANSLSVTTDTGTYAFTNVTYATSVTGYTVAHDPVTGLEVITFTGPDVFEQNVKATSGKFAGDYLWSNPANWSQGHAPVDGDSVVVADQAAVGYDDIASLALSRLSLNGSDLYVVGSNLTVASVTGGAHFVGNTFWYPTLWADASDAGAPVTVTIGAITDGPIANTSFTGEYYAVGSGARLIDQSNTDLGNEFFAGGGGLFQSSAVPASPSLLIYGSNLHGAYQPGPGTIALAHPGATNPGLLSNVGPGDVLELPGTSVNAVTFGTHSLSLTTNAGSYDFTNVNYLSPVTGYTTRFDPTTGLEAITFTGPDVFEANFKATSGKFAGDYLWSNPANWSQGHAPVDGDSVQIGTTNIVGYDDIASLSLSTLTLHLSTVNVVGQSLTVGTVNGGGVFAPQPQGGFSFLIADAAEAGAPVSVVVDTVTGTRGTYGAEGAGATFHDNSAVDPGDTYEMIGGGTVYLSATPASGTPASDYSDFWYGNGAAVLELPHAAGVSGSDIDFGPGNVLELPGSKVLSVGFTNGLSVTTDAGSYQFTGVASNVAGYSWADDASTGLVAITFTKTAPAAPALALLHDTGISATDHITNDPTLHYVLSNIADTFRFSVDGSGFSAVAPDFAAHPLADGVHTVSVEEVDPAGNASAASHLSFTLDTAAPHWTGLTASPGSGSAFAGTTVQLTLDFNEAVDVRGGTPSLTLNDGGTALYDAAATALLGDSSKLVFDHLVTSNTPSTTSLAVTGLVAHGATISDVAGNNSPADLSHVTATFGALAINESFAPAYSANGFTRPQLELDATGHIILDAAASAFAATYGIEFLYLGLPPSTPYPPVADASHDFHMP